MNTKTTEQQTFTQKFKSPPSKVDKTRKLMIGLRHVNVRGVSMKKNGGRRGDVHPDTLKKSLDEFPDHFLKIVGGRVFCEVCNRIPIRSCLTPTTYSYRYSHSLTNHHSSSRVSRSEGEGEEGVRGFGRLLAVWNYPLSYTCGRPSRK